MVFFVFFSFATKTFFIFFFFLVAAKYQKAFFKIMFTNFDFFFRMLTQTGAEAVNPFTSVILKLHAVG